jgi:hypothetical protein
LTRQGLEAAVLEFDFDRPASQQAGKQAGATALSGSAGCATGFGAETHAYMRAPATHDPRLLLYHDRNSFKPRRYFLLVRTMLLAMVLTVIAGTSPMTVTCKPPNCLE